ncbi:hypothetical protein STEG23_027473 [Scotinomys teguina]
MQSISVDTVESGPSVTLRDEANVRTMKATGRYDIFDPTQSISAQESTVVTRTWDSSRQITVGSIQLTSWLTTVKRNLGLFYFIFVEHHNPRFIGHIR